MDWAARPPVLPGRDRRHASRRATRRLAEIDTEPTEVTTALADLLIARLQAPPRRTGPRPAADPGEADA